MTLRTCDSRRLLIPSGGLNRLDSTPPCALLSTCGHDVADRTHVTCFMSRCFSPDDDLHPTHMPPPLPLLPQSRSIGTSINPIRRNSIRDDEKLIPNPDTLGPPVTQKGTVRIRATSSAPPPNWPGHPSPVSHDGVLFRSRGGDPFSPSDCHRIINALRS